MPTPRQARPAELIRLGVWRPVALLPLPGTAVPVCLFRKPAVKAGGFSAGCHGGGARGRASCAGTRRPCPFSAAPDRDAAKGVARDFVLGCYRAYVPVLRGRDSLFFHARGGRRTTDQRTAVRHVAHRVRDRAGSSTMRILVMGGTWFLGRAVVDVARARGWETSVFNRGRSGTVPSGVRTVLGDRTAAEDLARLAGEGSWDAVVDTSASEMAPRDVLAGACALEPVADRYVFVSTVNAYRGWPAEPLTEDSELLDGPPEADADYGRAAGGLGRSGLVLRAAEGGSGAGGCHGVR